jgi:hypothetical protein
MNKSLDNKEETTEKSKKRNSTGEPQKKGSIAEKYSETER